MPYFHESICISPQASYPEADLTQIRESVNNLLNVKEPDYPGIPAGVKRRMGKSVRMAVGAALPLLQKYPLPDGMIIATANGGMEDCIKFLNQIIEYNEGLLTPGSFVQSTSNAAAAQIALVTKNHQYNITHVHRGIAFENALMDTVMLLKEYPDRGYLLGCTDEISAYNYNIDNLAGWFRKEPVLNTGLFAGSFNGTIPGEGSFMVWMNNQREGATASLDAVRTIHTEDPVMIVNVLKKFLSENFAPGEMPDLLLTGENGDQRLLKYYEAVESVFTESVPVARFKHLCGEYCTATSFACWLSIQVMADG
ncbi:MAG TPA: beta-ketoacyl synthase chain length factor, partial [Puia sp.]|nr:beta-ketoacyl synthase chain length factor [Puia sp.]